MIGLLLVTSVPFATIAFRGKAMLSNIPTMSERITSADVWRPMQVPKDASITPTQAGVAFRTLTSSRPATNFPMQDVEHRAERPWRSSALTPDMFPTMRSAMFTGPSPDKVVRASRAGFTVKELAYLREISSASVWDAYDVVARAPQVDLLGARFVLPFRDNAFAPSMPSPSFGDTKELAYAGVSRAAYYLATGQRERAESALRSIVSFGFAFIDNGTSSLDALVGRVIVGIGYDGLRQFFEVTGDPRSATLAAPPALGTFAAKRTPATIERLLSDANNPQMPRALRFESLGLLSYSSCSTVNGALNGPSAEIRNAFAAARTNLVRTPAEALYLDMLYYATNRVPDNFAHAFGVDQLILGASDVAGTLLHHPRLASCTRFVTAMR